MVELLLAWYLSVMVPTQLHPVMIGPFDTQDHCWEVRELLTEQNYETDDCSFMILLPPEDTQPWEYPFPPHYEYK